MSRIRVGRGALASLVIALVAGCSVPQAPVTFHPASAMVRIGGADGTAVPRQARSYRLMMVRNEREGFQFALLPAGGTEVPATVSVSAETPDAPAVMLYQVLPVNHVAPPTTGQFVVPPRRLGLVPDVLMPLPAHVTTARIASGEMPVTYYVEFRTVAKTQPGRYRYSVKVLSGQALAAMNVQVTVGEPVIPDRLPFRTATTWNWSVDDYFGRTLTEQEKQAFWDFFLDQRLSPTAFFAKVPNPGVAEAATRKDRGLLVMNLTFVGGKKPKPLAPAVKEKIGPQLKQWREELKAAGMLEAAVVLLADEPEPGTAGVCRENARWLKEQFPEVKIWVATRPTPEWDFADVFDPVTAHSTDFYKAHSHSDEALAWLRKTHPRTEYWWFHSVEPYGPYPNIRLDNLPIEARVSGWQSALYGVDGYEYFWMTDWKANKESKDVPWPERAARWQTGMSGAGTLCYPDERGLPIPSLRLVNLRDGLEDWALIEMAAPQRDMAGRRGLVGQVTGRLAEYTIDPQVVLRARARVIGELENRRP